MNKKINTFIVSVIVVFMAFFALSQVVLAEDDAYGLDATAKIGYNDQSIADDSKPDITSKVGTVIGVALSFLGLIFFILMIYAGFMWMTAGGNEENVKKSIELITQAVVGMVIVATAYLLTKFVGEQIINKF